MAATDGRQRWNALFLKCYFTQNLEIDALEKQW